MGLQLSHDHDWLGSYSCSYEHGSNKHGQLEVN